MKCPHCQHEFLTEQTGLVDCPACKKPVFVRPPVVIPDEQPAPIADESVAEDDRPAEEVAASAVAESENEPSAEDGQSATKDLENHAKSAGGISLEQLFANARRAQTDPQVVFVMTPPWEDKQLSLWQRFWQTVKVTLFMPQAFFLMLPETFSRLPLYYSYIIWFIFFLVTLGSQCYLLFSDPQSLLTALGDGAQVIDKTFGSIDNLKTFMLVLLAGTPLWAFLPSYLFAMLLHGLLWLFHLDRGYPHALRLVCYASTPLLLCLIPPLFGLAAVAMLPLYCIAITYGYRANFLLSLPLALLVTITGGCLLVNVMTSLAQLIAL